MEYLVENKISIKDIFASFKDIFFNNIDKDEEKINKRLEAIKRVEAQIGASDRIEKLVEGMKNSSATSKRKTPIHNKRQISVEQPSMESQEYKIKEDYERDI